MTVIVFNIQYIKSALQYWHTVFRHKTGIKAIKAFVYALVNDKFNVVGSLVIKAS